MTNKKSDSIKKRMAGTMRRDDSVRRHAEKRETIYPNAEDKKALAEGESVARAFRQIEREFAKVPPLQIPQDDDQATDGEKSSDNAVNDGKPKPSMTDRLREAREKAISRDIEKITAEELVANQPTREEIDDDDVDNVADANAATDNAGAQSDVSQSADINGEQQPEAVDGSTSTAKSAAQSDAADQSHDKGQNQNQAAPAGDSRSEEAVRRTIVYKHRRHLTSPIKLIPPSVNLYAQMYRVALRVLYYTYGMLQKFPRSQKTYGGIACDIEGRTRKMVSSLISIANYNPYNNRERMLRELSVELKTLCMLVSISTRSRYINQRNLEAWTYMLTQLDDMAIGIAMYLEKRPDRNKVKYDPTEEDINEGAKLYGNGYRAKKNEQKSDQADSQSSDQTDSQTKTNSGTDK